jgi:acyl carrier protein
MTITVVAMSLTSCLRKRSSTHQTLVPNTPQASSGSAQAQADDIHARVAKQIADILGLPISSITAEKNLFNDLGADSLDAVEIVMTLEEEFELSIDDASAEKMRSVGDVEYYIRNYRKP